MLLSKWNKKTKSIYLTSSESSVILIENFKTADLRTYTRLIDWKHIQKSIHPLSFLGGLSQKDQVRYVDEILGRMRKWTKKGEEEVKKDSSAKYLFNWLRRFTSAKYVQFCFEQVN